MTAADEFHADFLRAASSQGYDAGDAERCAEGALTYVSRMAVPLASVASVRSVKDRRRMLKGYHRGLERTLYAFLPALPWWALIARFALQRFVSWAVEWILERWASRPEALVVMARGQ